MNIEIQNQTNEKDMLPQRPFFDYGRLVSRSGITKLSNLLIRDMKLLGLEPKEVIFLAYLLSHPFLPKNGGVVCASLKTMHRDTGISLVTIHELKDNLAAKGFIAIKRERNRERTNGYDMNPLRVKLEEFARSKKVDQIGSALARAEESVRPSGQEGETLLKANTG
jgi:DNA-binding MarR family transcriptional regulator